MTSLTLISLLGIASQVAAQIEKSTATCTHAKWTFFKGNSPCQLWENLQAVCDPSASVAALDIASNANAQYRNPSGTSATSCQCNTVAYNLMAACTWCQPSFYDNWVSEAQWKNECSGYDSSGLPSQASPLSSEIPPWAFTVQKGQSWLAPDASRIAEAGPTATIENRQLAGTDLSTNTGLASGTGFPTAAPTFGATGTGFSSITRPTTSRFSTTRFPTATRTSFRGSSDNVSPGLAKIVAILILISLGSYVAFGLITLFVCFRRQKNRKALYGPTAQFYRNGGRMDKGDQTLLAPSQPWEQPPPAAHADPFRTPTRTPSPPPVPGPDIMNYGQAPQRYAQHHYGAYAQQPATYPPPQRHVNRV